MEVGRASDLLDLWLSAPVARQAQTTVSATGGLRLAAPCSVAAASARRCGKRGVRDHLFVTQMTQLLMQRAPTVVRGQHRAGRVSDRKRNVNMTGSGVYGATLEITRLTSASARPGLEPGPCKIHPVGTCHAVRMAKTNTQVCAMYVRVARGTWGRRRPTQAAERRHGRRLQ